MQEPLHPTSPRELADALATAASADRSISLAGASTKSRWAGPLPDADVRISTTRMNRLLEYEPRDLTISVEAGMRFADLAGLLYQNHQMIPLDPCYPGTATVGGVIAANQSGPRRRLYGTARDLVIGMQFATLEGKLIQSGGMVVKNVAGLDMAKLMIGSWGTLAGIATVNFKLIPRDHLTRAFLFPFDSAKDALAMRNRILSSVTQPAAIDLLNPAASRQLGRDRWLLAVGVGGTQALLDRYTREFADAIVLSDDAEREFWHGVQAFAETFLEVHTRGGMIRVSTPLQSLAAAISEHNGPVIARAGNGVAYLFCSDLPKALPQAKGSWPSQEAAYLVEAGPAARGPENLWPDPGNGLAVMQSVKNMLDPKNLLNRGRLYGRI